jgi:hypothetical protein
MADTPVPIANTTQPTTSVSPPVAPTPTPNKTIVEPPYTPKPKRKYAGIALVLAVAAGLGVYANQSNKVRLNKVEAPAAVDVAAVDPVPEPVPAPPAVPPLPPEAPVPVPTPPVVLNPEPTPEPAPAPVDPTPVEPTPKPKPAPKPLRECDPMEKEYRAFRTWWYWQLYHLGFEVDQRDLKPKRVCK